MELQTKKNKAIKITLWGSLVDFLLGTSKVLIGFLFHSQALIIDGFHSLSDLITDGFILMMAKYSFEHPDDEHPYGHGKFETLGTIVIGVMLMLVAIFLAYDNIQLLIDAEQRHLPQWPTLIIAFFSIISKELIYRFTMKVGKELNSQMLIANAWHSRSDAYSSILVFVGLLFAMLGFPNVDLFMAVGLSFFIGKIGWDFIWRSLKELVDTSLDEETRNIIKTTISKIDGVKGLHNLRSRKIGDKAILDVNIEVSPNISVSEGHEIATWVAHKIIEKVDAVYDVTVHTDVEDDREDGKDYISYERELLPLRGEVEAMIIDKIGNDHFKDIKKLVLHYVDSKIELELFYLPTKTNLEEIEKILLEIPIVSKVHFFLIL